MTCNKKRELTVIKNGEGLGMVWGMCMQMAWMGYLHIG